MSSPQQVGFTKIGRACWRRVLAGGTAFDILLNMTKLLEEAVKELRSLPEDEQDRAAEALFAFARERAD
jgi:hypothetical protein